SIKIAAPASDRPNEFKNMRGNIDELLFACKYVHKSDDNNLGTVEHKVTGHQSNDNEDVSRGDKELKDSLAGCYAQASLPQINLSTFFDGIDDDGEHSGYVEKRLHIPATSGAPKRRLARQQHEPRVLAEETGQKKLGVTKRKFEEENRIAKQMKMQRRTNVMQDDLLSQPRVFTEKAYRPRNCKEDMNV
ncbi:hypothetical protein Tco_0854601, partial [Tanacetum coccineum]